jgi:hypothetical protein
VLRVANGMSKASASGGRGACGSPAFSVSDSASPGTGYTHRHSPTSIYESAVLVYACVRSQPRARMGVGGRDRDSRLSSRAAR